MERWESVSRRRSTLKKYSKEKHPEKLFLQGFLE
jgi:hypothetical protein